MQKKLLDKISELIQSHERADSNVMLFTGFAYLLIIYRDKTIGYRFNLIENEVVVNECAVEKIQATIKDMCKI